MASDATDGYTCCFCNEKFSENAQFWAHMSAGNCEAKAELPPPPPLTVQVNNSHLNEGSKGLAIHIPPHSSFASSTFSFSSSSAAAAATTSTTTATTTTTASGVNSSSSSGTTNAYDFTQMTNAVPFFGRSTAQQPQQQQQQPPRQEVPLPCKQPAAPNGPLFIPKVNSQPTMTNSAPAAPPKTTTYDKWKCTLCNVTFSDKTQLVAHVGSPEHESRLPANPKVSKPFPRPTTSSSTLMNGATAPPPQQPPLVAAPPLFNPSKPPPSFVPTIVNGQVPQYQSPPLAPSPSLPNQEALAQMIRKIFAEEIRPLVREEVRSLLRPLFQDQPGSDTASPVAKFGSNNNNTSSLSNGSDAVAASSSVLEPRGVGYYCHACNCPVPSQVNLEMHCTGKKHKAALDKMSF